MPTTLVKRLEPEMALKFGHKKLIYATDYLYIFFNLNYKLSKHMTISCFERPLVLFIILDLDWGGCCVYS